MKFGSVCSGIEAASVAWKSLGWSATWLAEIEKFPSAVLAHHWPMVPNMGDMCQLPSMLRAGFLEAPDILVGGTPCQAFSVAGLRKGLLDTRGQLTIKFVEIANAIDEQRANEGSIIVWENVPGVLSSKDNAFGCFLGALVGEDCSLKPAGKKWSNAGCVYGPQRTVAWRVLDAQYFGLAQRRRRVFIVASSRKGFDPAAVLFESEGVRRDTPPSRKTETTVAALTANGVGPCGADDNQAITDTGGGGETVVCMATGQASAEIGVGVGTTLNCNHEAPIIFNCDVMPDRMEVTCSQHPAVASFEPGIMSREGNHYYPEISGTLRSNPGDNRMAVAIAVRTAQASSNGWGINKAIAYTLDSAQGQAVAYNQIIRRLTPVECERLQGFPDNYTLIPWRNKCPDGPRYKALGNSMAVPVMHWIGRRIKEQLA